MGEEFSETVYNDGEIIVREGTKGNELYIVQSGKVKVIKDTGGTETVLTVLHEDEGDIFGEMGLSDGEICFASVKAVGKAKLLGVNKGMFLERTRTHPEVVLEILCHMSMRMRAMNTMLGKTIEILRKVQEKEEL